MRKHVFPILLGLISTTANAFEMTRDEYTSIAAMHAAEYYVLSGKCPGLSVDFQEMKSQHSVFTPEQLKRLNYTMASEAMPAMLKVERMRGADGVCQVIRQTLMRSRTSTIVATR